MALARAQLSQLAIRYNRTKVVNFLPPPLILWLAVAAVVVLLAPYAGVHILTSPPAVEEQRATLNPISEPLAPVSDQSLPSSSTGREMVEAGSESLADINGMLSE